MHEKHFCEKGKDMTKDNLMKDRETPDQKLSALIEMESLKTDGTLSGECIIHCKDPQVNASDAYFLPAGEIREINAGESFAIMTSADPSSSRFESYTALEPVTLEGPMVWTGIEAPESVLDRLKDAESFAVDEEDLVIVFACFFIIFSLIATCFKLIHIEGDKGYLLFAFFIMALGLSATWALKKGIELYWKSFFDPEAEIFTTAKEIKIPKDILGAISKKKTLD
jgi:hypothetical protein